MYKIIRISDSKKNIIKRHLQLDFNRQEYEREATILLKRSEKLIKEMYSFDPRRMEINCSNLEAAAQRLKYLAKIVQYNEEI